MKYEVITPFVDKYTGEEYPAGDLIEITAERAKELQGYIKKHLSKNKKKADD